MVPHTGPFEAMSQLSKQFSYYFPFLHSLHMHMLSPAFLSVLLILQHLFDFKKNPLRMLLLPLQPLYLLLSCCFSLRPAPSSQQSLGSLSGAYCPLALVLSTSHSASRGWLLAT